MKRTQILTARKKCSQQIDIGPAEVRDKVKAVAKKRGQHVREFARRATLKEAGVDVTKYL